MAQSDLYNIVLDCLDRHAGQGSKTAFLSVSDALKVESFTFRRLAEQTHRFANGLTDRGFKPGDSLIISLPNGPEFPTAFLGAVRAGVIPIPVSPLLTPDELDFLFKDSGAKEIVTGENFKRFVRSRTSEFSFKAHIGLRSRLLALYQRHGGSAKGGDACAFKHSRP